MLFSVTRFTVIGYRSPTWEPNAGLCLVEAVGLLSRVSGAERVRLATWDQRGGDVTASLGQGRADRASCWREGVVGRWLLTGLREGRTSQLCHSFLG